MRIPALSAEFLLLALTPASGAELVVTTTDDTADGTGSSHLSLRETVQVANAAPGADVIVLPAGRYVLGIPGAAEDAAASGDLDILGELEIRGAGSAGTWIDGGGIDRVIHVLPGAGLTISGVFIRGGGGIDFTGNGGGILNQGTLVASSVLIGLNAVGDPGRGAGVFSSGTMTLRRSSVFLNTNDTSGGGIESSGDMTIISSAIHGNFALGTGGGIQNQGALLVASSTIAGNGVESHGGGLCNDGGDVTIESCTIADNIAAPTSGSHHGGGVFNGGGSVTLQGSILARNVAAGGGDAYGEGITSLGHNCLGSSGLELAAGDRTGDAGLAGLTDDGEPGNAHLPLLPSSVAIDAGDGGSCPPVDQLGQPRSDGDGDGSIACDAGAAEFRRSCSLETIVEAGGAGSSFAGAWHLSDAPGHHGTSSYWARATATVTPRSQLGSSVPPGIYDVFEWHTRWTSRTRSARHRILHAGGASDVIVDQSVGGGRWNRLGSFELRAAEPSASVLARVEILAEDPIRSTNADAVRFLCRSPLRPTAFIDGLTSPGFTFDTVSFTGHGEGSLPIAAYEWTSDREPAGPLSTQNSFTRYNLAEGTHSISFRVADAAGSWSLPVQAQLFVLPNRCTVDVVIDNGDPGTSSTGSWRASAAPGSHGSGSLWSRSAAAGLVPRYTFAAQLPPGEYEILEWHSSWPTRTRAARLRVDIGGATLDFLVDQSTNGARWNSLGQIFRVGGPIQVTILAEDRVSSTNADAVRFVCVGAGN